MTIEHNLTTNDLNLSSDIDNTDMSYLSTFFAINYGELDIVQNPMICEPFHREKKKVKEIEIEESGIVKPLDEIIEWNQSFKPIMRITNFYSQFIDVLNKVPSYVSLLKEFGISESETKGEIKSWTKFQCDKGHFYCFPNAVVGQFNPFNLWKSVTSSAIRSRERLNTYSNLRVIHQPTFTYPKEVSLMTYNKDFDYIARTNKCMAIMQNEIECKLTGFKLTKKGKPKMRNGMRIPNGQIHFDFNTHTWASSNPLEPHLHHHVNMFDVYFPIKITKKNKDSALKNLRRMTVTLFTKRDNNTKRNYDNLFNIWLKQTWTNIINKEFNLKIKQCVVHYRFDRITKGNHHLLHFLKYCRRKPLVDVADYCMKNEIEIDKINKVYFGRLIRYANKTKTMGYNAKLLLSRIVVPQRKEYKHYCPICHSEAHIILDDPKYDSKIPFVDVFVDRNGNHTKLVSRFHDDY